MALQKMGNIKMKINSLDLKRKILHILLGIIGLFLLTYNIITPFQIFIILIIGIAISLISLKFNIPIISYFLDNFEKQEDRKELPGRGVIFAVTGSLLVLKLFSYDIALASITILIFADPISHLSGKFFGKTKSFLDKRKNIEGNIFGALISGLLATFFIPFYLALTASITAMLFESIIIEIQKIELDDNLIIPLVAATTIYILKIIIL